MAIALPASEIWIELQMRTHKSRRQDRDLGAGQTCPVCGGAMAIAIATAI